MEIFSYGFFLNALYGAVLTSLCCGMLGTYIVTRRIVFISGGISHASFGGVGIAHFLGWEPFLGASLFALAASQVFQWLSTRSEFRQDSLIGILWSSGMAVGILFIFLTPGYSANLISYLFGNILTISQAELLVMGGLTLVTLIVFISLYRSILAISFNEEYARSQGLPVTLINHLMIALVALTIVITIKMIGIILVISLLTLPQATAGILSSSFKGMIVLSTFFGLLACLAGLLTSYAIDIPSGASIILSAVLLFLLVKIIHRLRRKISSQRQTIS